MKVKVAKDDSINGCLLVEVSVAAAFCKEFSDYLGKHGRCSGRLSDADLMPVVGAEFLHAMSSVEWARLYGLLLTDEQNFARLTNEVNKGGDNE